MRAGGARRALVVVAASAALALLPAAPASAHNYVVATTPAEGSTITEQPGAVSLTTNDDLLDFGENTVLQVVGPDGRHYETGCAVVDGATAEVEAELGEAGAYTVAWQVVSTDGHPISGEFGFDWQPAAGQPVGAGADASPCGDSSEGGADAVPVEPAEPAPAPSPVPVGDLLWIGGGLLALLAAALVTWLLVRRRSGD
jgi:methionine-rich copper-binding protein CopC